MSRELNYFLGSAIGVIILFGVLLIVLECTVGKTTEAEKCVITKTLDCRD